MKTHSPAHIVPFADHLQELRRRLLWCVAVFIGGTFVGWAIHQAVTQWLVRPLNQQLYYSSPTGGLDFIVRISFFVGFLIAVPMMVYQLLRFIEPVLPERSLARTFRFMVVSVGLAATGVALAYFVSLPAALKFISGFNSPQVSSLISADSYLNFVLTYMAAYALLFQLPLILVFIDRIKPQKPRKLMSLQGYVILGSFVIGGILTPTPDPANQALMAGPIIVLYQIGLLAIVWQHQRRRSTAQKQQVVEAPALATQPDPVSASQPLLPALSRGQLRLVGGVAVEPLMTRQRVLAYQAVPDQPSTLRPSRPRIIQDIVPMRRAQPA